MRRARLGIEPANKVFIDTDQLRRLYVKNKNNARQVAQELGVSYNSVKNRLQKLGWARSTK